MHVASVELLHPHQDHTTNEGEDERGDVGVGEVFANVNEGLVERASCLWAPTPSSHPAPPLVSDPVKGYHQNSWRHTTAEFRPWSQTPCHFLPPSPKGHVWSTCWDRNADSLSLPLERVYAKGGGAEARHKEGIPRQWNGELVKSAPLLSAGINHREPHCALEVVCLTFPQHSLLTWGQPALA